MKTLFLCATLVLALVPTAISAAQNCASITKGQKKCKNAGCKWDFKTGAKRKSCSGIVVEDATDAVEDAPDVAVVGCWKFDKKRKCERKGCDWTKAGKSFKSCNDPAPRPSTTATVDPTAAAAPKAPSKWDTKPGCCRAGGEQADVLSKETYSAVSATDADAMCANQCFDDLNCTAYEITKKKKAKKNKSAQPKFICELHDSKIDSASKRTKSCRAATTTCNIYVSGRCPTAPLPLTNDNFTVEIAKCLATNPVDGNCVNSTHGPMPCWDVGSITDFSNAFRVKGNPALDVFNAVITAWNTSAATAMNHMFFNTRVFNQELKDWDTGAVTTFESMFHGAVGFNQELKGWDTGAVTTFKFMFATNAASVFNQEIKDWDTGAATTFDLMFAGAAAFNQPLNEWDTGAATTFNSMFAGAAAFNQPLNEWDTGAATTFESTFVGAVDFNQELNEWDTGAVTTFDRIFDGAVAFNQELNKWDTGAATDFDRMFNGAAAFNQDVSGWDTGFVTSSDKMFTSPYAGSCSIDSNHAITC